MGYYALLLAGLVAIVIQDFKERAISIWTLPLVFFSGWGVACQNEVCQLWFMGANMLFITLQWLGVSLYFSFKHQTWVNITDRYLGLGDLLFFVAITPLFSPLHFCLFFIGALLVTLLFAGGYHYGIKPITTIPLAGAMSLCWMGYTLGLAGLGTSPYDDWPLLLLLYE